MTGITPSSTLPLSGNQRSTRRGLRSVSGTCVAPASGDRREGSWVYSTRGAL